MSDSPETYLHRMNYRPPALLRGGHLLSIYPTLFRKLDDGAYERERMETDDGDFLDLDWARLNSRPDRIAIVSHGLEGHSRRAYVLGMVRALNDAGWDALAWNYRSCSGEPNRQLRFYHNGATDDLDRVIGRVRKENRYAQIALIGFSLGGNLSLLYLGQRGQEIEPDLAGAVAFSVPCDIKSSAAVLAKPSNAIYMKRFLRDLRQKVRDKMALFPDQIDDRGYEKIRDFKGFDDRYTAPIHGFRDAHDYWEKCSSKPHLPRIAIPTLIVNALDDPFLTPECFPREEVAGNPHLFLKTPARGGHVGFVSFNPQGRYWSEAIATGFLDLAVYGKAAPVI